MSEEAIAFLEDLFKKVSETDEWKQYIEENGAVNAYLNSEGYDAYIDDQVPRWTQLIQDMGIEIK